VSTHKRIGITLGDPTGIGPEIVAAAVADAEPSLRRRLMIFCDRPILDRAFAQVTGGRVPAEVKVVDRGLLGADRAIGGQPTSASAAAQIAYLEAAVAAARGQSIAGLVTAPISKRSAKQAGFAFAGHTEFLAERLGSKQVAMMFVGPRLKVVLATVHVALSDVPKALTVEGITGVARLAAESLARDFGHGDRPVRLGVLGLNPHAGEHGLFGREEQDVIGPAIEALRREFGSRVEVTGPLVPDAAFRQAADGSHDVLVAMYHDQGLIPVKLVDFEKAVNVTLGLPIVRTSPDHGVAHDIAGTGKARPDSFIAALRLAVEMVERRAAGKPSGEPATEPAIEPATESPGS
jgi:4-hydroxythreonine-4-phosphate dehydrogenase